MGGMRPGALACWHLREPAVAGDRFPLELGGRRRPVKGQQALPALQSTLQPSVCGICYGHGQCTP